MCYLFYWLCKWSIIGVETMPCYGIDISYRGCTINVCLKLFFKLLRHNLEMRVFEVFRTM